MIRARPVVLVLLLSLVACRSATGDASERARDRAGFAGGGPVLLVGDSILVGADEIGHVRELLAERGWEPELDAAVGRSPRTAIQLVAARDRVPADVVLVLGSNPSPTLGDFPAEIEEMVQALQERGARRIVWIPPRHRDPQRYAERAQALMDAAAEHDVLTVPDWSAVVDEYPWIIGGDGLHLSAQGTVLLAYFIGSALSVANGAPGPARIPEPDATPPSATFERDPPPPAPSSSPSPTPSPSATRSPSPTPTPTPSPSATRTGLPTPTPSVLPSPSPSPSETPSPSESE